MKPSNDTRIKPEDRTRLTEGEAAKHIRLAEQYRLAPQGDVARRLDLERRGDRVGGPHTLADIDLPRHGDVAHGPHGPHGPHNEFHHGAIHADYPRHCTAHRYWGPAYFSGTRWYPHWDSWVVWSWNVRCYPRWDPRPLWCRPIYYDPCPPWVYWETPAWTPLPVVSCGTWVDVEPIVLAEEQTDVQLVAVRFVDPGHPEEKLGPRYRVWFRNNGDAPIVRPFNVTLFASNDDRLAGDLPQAGVRVVSIDGGDTQSVDVRLPYEVYTMNRDAQGNPAPFGVLHVLVDANRETPDTFRTNNGVRLAPAEILPVDPAAFEIEPAAAAPGAETVLAGEGFGPEPGQVLVNVAGRELDGEILGWYDLGVRFTVPKLAVAGPIEAEVIVVRGDGAASNPLKMTITP